ncbi:MAG: hypothetical protein ACTHVE_01490 [Senegalia sp. (in: firmicutes)]
MTKKIMNSIIAGTVLSAVGMYASAKMSPKQRRKMMKNTRNMFTNMI